MYSRVSRNKTGNCCSSVFFSLLASIIVGNKKFYFVKGVILCKSIKGVYTGSVCIIFVVISGVKRLSKLYRRSTKEMVVSQHRAACIFSVVTLLEMCCNNLCQTILTLKRFVAIFFNRQNERLYVKNFLSLKAVSPNRLGVEASLRQNVCSHVHQEAINEEP